MDRVEVKSLVVNTKRQGLRYVALGVTKTGINSTKPEREPPQNFI
jgi:hypothetical protein